MKKQDTPVLNLSFLNRYSLEDAPANIWIYISRLTRIVSGVCCAECES